jgi:hypothetical protein
MAACVLPDALDVAGDVRPREGRAWLVDRRGVRWCALRAAARACTPAAGCLSGGQGRSSPVLRREMTNGLKFASGTYDLSVPRGKRFDIRGAAGRARVQYGCSRG